MKRLALAAGLLLAPPAFAQDDPHAGHDMGAMTPPGYDDPEALLDYVPHRGALGDHLMSREGSGTSWQPEDSPMGGAYLRLGHGGVTVHALLNGVRVDQGGPRGGDKTFVSGMVGFMDWRDVGPGKLTLKAMLSPAPFMGKSGYPLLTAAGETADGVQPLTDRQHPHDLFMELSATYGVTIGERGSAFVYAGLPGEPAFGPPAFMHRASSLDSPEAPITHHWLDSTHVVFGVVTGGLTWDRWKLDASAFRGREPDENRFDIETGALDSRAVRLSFNPTDRWALQTSWASIESPEALEPHHDERRTSLSAMYVRELDWGGLFAATAAWARKDKVPGEVLDAALLEASYAPDDRWTLFARAEQVEQDELGGGGHGPAYTVRKASVGAIHDWRVSEHVKVGVGALVSGFDIEDPLGASYGDPAGTMAFVRLKIG